jgi:hypothetical protein
MAKSTETALSLSAIANQLETTAKGLHNIVRTSKRAQTLTGEALAKKIPTLSPLGDTVLFRIRLGRNGLILCDTVGIWVGEDNSVGVYGPDLRPIPGAEILKWTATIKGNTLIKIAGLVLEIGFNPSDTALGIYVDDGKNDNSPRLNGEGTPPVELVETIPQPEIPLYSEEMEIDVTYEILKMGKESKKYQSLMVDVKNLKTGQILSNVITNSELKKIVTTHGIGAKFQIVGKAVKTDKQGNPVDADGKVNRSKPAHIVKIADLQGLDFSDLV